MRLELPYIAVKSKGLHWTVNEKKKKKRNGKPSRKLIEIKPTEGFDQR